MYTLAERSRNLIFGFLCINGSNRFEPVCVCDKSSSHVLWLLAIFVVLILWCRCCCCFSRLNFVCASTFPFTKWFSCPKLFSSDKFTGHNSIWWINGFSRVLIICLAVFFSFRLRLWATITLCTQIYSSTNEMPNAKFIPKMYVESERIKDK